MSNTHLDKSNLKKTTARVTSLFVMLSVLYTWPVVSLAARPEKRESTRVEITEDERFDRIFQEGRDLIYKEEWAKAILKFNEIVCDCPETKHGDAALYWLAFSYKKQHRLKETESTLDRLLRVFPNSSWANDAYVMKCEIGAELSSGSNLPPGRNGSMFEPVGVNVSRNGNRIDQPEPPDTESAVSQIDREDEIRLAAFQSLLSSNAPKRAIDILASILKPESKASTALRSEVVRTIRQQRRTTIGGKGEYPLYESFTSKLSGELLPILQTTLENGFQSEKNIEVRTEIIYALASISDDRAGIYLVQIFKSTSDKDIKKAIINSFGGAPAFLTEAYFSINSTRAFNFNQLLEIVKNETDAELRRLAFLNLRRIMGWSAKDGVITTISQVYEALTDEELKISIIQAFAASKQDQATMKLLDIARHEKSNKLRLEAIRSLKSSSNPAVLKFLEDTISPF